jgi:hypothetical protein
MTAGFGSAGGMRVDGGAIVRTLLTIGFVTAALPGTVFMAGVFVASAFFAGASGAGTFLASARAGAFFTAVGTVFFLFAAAAIAVRAIDFVATLRCGLCAATTLPDVLAGAFLPATFTLVRDTVATERLPTADLAVFLATFPATFLAAFFAAFFTTFFATFPAAFLATFFVAFFAAFLGAFFAAVFCFNPAFFIAIPHRPMIPRRACASTQTS